MKFLIFSVLFVALAALTVIVDLAVGKVDLLTVLNLILGSWYVRNIYKITGTMNAKIKYAEANAPQFYGWRKSRA